MRGPSALRATVLGIVLLGAACAAPPPPRATIPVYSYSMAGPTVDRHPGDRVPLVWKATRSGATSAAPDALRVCVALVGPFATIEDLKAFPIDARSCPLTGARVAVAGPVAEIDPRRGDDVAQDLVLPTTIAPGFYQFISVQMYGPTVASGWTSAAGVLRVVVP